MITFSQTLYEKGILFLQNGDYVKADSMFTLAIEALPFDDAYFNRAITRLKMHDMKGFSLDIKKASSYDDKEAEKLHKQYCINVDTIYYTEAFEKVKNKSYYLEIINQEKYYDFIEGFVYDKKENLIAKYKIQNNFKWFVLSPNMPEFIGGEKKLLKFIKTHLVYPISEMDAYKKYAGTAVTVYVQFDISSKGKVENVQISDDKKEQTKKYISENFVNEAMRVVGLLPDFKPGTFMGKPIVVRYVAPIEFNFPQ
jgi:hypothetical protein